MRPACAPLAAVELQSGDLMPPIGFGTCCRPSASGSELVASTLAFLQQGGRLIDTAQMYGNHREIAEAIRASRVDRSELWLTSKVNTRVVKSRGAALRSINTSLGELDLPFINLMLVHSSWGLTSQQLLDVWRALIQARDEGMVRNIGVSNLVRHQIEQLEQESGVRPAVNEIEFHPWVPNSTFQLVEWCTSRGIAVTAYGSLGGSANSLGSSSEVSSLAKRHNVSNAQVLLRWSLQQGVAVIPGASSTEHIIENLHLPRFCLSQAESDGLIRSPMPRSFTRWYNLESEWGPLTRAWQYMTFSSIVLDISIVAALAVCVMLAIRHRKHKQLQRADPLAMQDANFTSEDPAELELTSRPGASSEE
ncbi:hypothetical protein AB1Y20_021294 [Prymnesium parvum]|uniref:NADP-dependent oxidoreductase domain-containing protein n=1 Tax=Prymnesium parvum TaxID=97485 RepID=A0AB34JJQ6_PRYPA